MCTNNYRALKNLHELTITLPCYVIALYLKCDVQIEYQQFMHDKESPKIRKADEFVVTLRSVEKLLLFSDIK